ncbi:IPT/TIG domain-containing protein [Streptomyces sp. MMS24-I29]|uniref:IPT/TIG domain-containing protein n=1 Tax=Streptomyces sp. MMS24-I29 TaxID=3351480 RepID=UPI003C7DB818
MVEVTVVLANGQFSNGLPFYYIPAPVESTLSPTAGPLASGTGVTITGSGLATTSAVSFGGSSATVVSKSDGQLTVAAPAGTAGPVDVSVTTAAGTFDGLSYTYVASPGTLTITPNTGLLTGGTRVTVTTTGDATTTSQVLFGSTSVPFAVGGTHTLTRGGIGRRADGVESGDDLVGDGRWPAAALAEELITQVRGRRTSFRRIEAWGAGRAAHALIRCHPMSQDKREEWSC